MRRFSLRLVPALLLTACFACELSAQQTEQLPASPPDQGSSSNPITSLASEFLQHDFINYYAFANLVYDTEPISFQGRTVNEGGIGFDGGGGLDAQKIFRDGFFSIAYRGDYRDYTSTVYPSGTDQYLSLQYRKRLGRRWSVDINAGGGIFLYGGTYFGPTPSLVNYAQTNPLSTESRFLNGGIALTYRQTRRLSYVFNGQFYLNRYNYNGAFGSTGLSGTGSVLYQTTARTTVGGTYSHTYFVYQYGAGNMSADTIGVTLSHHFSARWDVSVMGGMTRTDSNGTIRIPVLIVDGNSLLPGYEIGGYHRVSTFPSFSGTLNHHLRRTTLSINGGQTITSGNGVYLASRDLFVSGFYSYSMPRSNISFGGTISQLSSVANAVAYTYDSAGFTANYSYNLMRHVGLNARYDFVRYGTLGSVGSSTDNRFTVGVYFSSKSIPLTLF